MPNRIIKESICISETIDQMSWFEECFFDRLIVNCDDYGRMDARPLVLKSKLFPLKERLSVKDVENALQRLADIGCVKLYECDSKPYLYLPTWGVHQTIRAKKSRYPDPDTCTHIQASASKCKQTQADVPVIQSESESESNPKERADAPDPFAEKNFPAGLKAKLTEWLRYKQERREAYKPTGLKSFLSEVENKRSLFSDEAIIALIGECMSNNWKGLIWDKLKGQEHKAKPTTYDIDAFEASGAFDTFGGS